MQTIRATRGGYRALREKAQGSDTGPFGIDDICMHLANDERIAINSKSTVPVLRFSSKTPSLFPPPPPPPLGLDLGLRALYTVVWRYLTTDSN
jgi:hypothetical protein